MMLAGKHSSARDPVEERARITARNEHTFALNAGRIIPLDGDAMSGVLARQTENARQARGSNLFQADEADAHQRMSFVKLGSKRSWKDALHDGRISSEINEQPSLDCAFDDWNAHE